MDVQIQQRSLGRTRVQLHGTSQRVVDAAAQATLDRPQQRHLLLLLVVLVIESSELSVIVSGERLRPIDASARFTTTSAVGTRQPEQAQIDVHHAQRRDAARGMLHQLQRSLDVKGNNRFPCDGCSYLQLPAFDRRQFC